MTENGRLLQPVGSIKYLLVHRIKNSFRKKKKTKTKKQSIETEQNMWGTFHHFTIKDIQMAGKIYEKSTQPPF